MKLKSTVLTQARAPARHYQHSEMGYKYRLSNVLAAIGRGQLRVLDERVTACRRVFDQYHQALADIGGTTTNLDMERIENNNGLEESTDERQKFVPFFHPLSCFRRGAKSTGVVLVPFCVSVCSLS